MNPTAPIILGVILGASGMLPALVASALVGVVLVKTKKIKPDFYVYACSLVIGINASVLAVCFYYDVPVSRQVIEAAAILGAGLLHATIRTRLVGACLSAYHAYSAAICVVNYVNPDTSFTQVQFAASLILRLAICALFAFDSIKQPRPKPAAPN